MKAEGDKSPCDVLITTDAGRIERVERRRVGPRRDERLELLIAEGRERGRQIGIADAASHSDDRQCHAGRQRLAAEVGAASEIEARLARRLAIAFWKGERKAAKAMISRQTPDR